MSRPEVSVFIPARNEQENVAPLMDKVAKTFAENRIDGEVVFVDDGSTDSTGDEAEKAAAKYDFVNVIHHRTNLGLTEAFKTAFDHVRGDVIVFLCADLESDPEEDIPKLLTEIRNGYDMVVGWRQGRRDTKIVASKIYNFVSRRLFNVSAHDMNWIKAFRRELIDDLPLRSDWHRFLYMLAASQGYKVTEVKTGYHPRRRGRSKYGLTRIPISFLDVIGLKFQLVFSRKPLLFFGGIGSILIGISLVFGVVFVVQWLMHTFHFRPIVLLATMLFLSGVQLFITGFLAELIVTQREEMERLDRRLKKYEHRE
ncbi:MAG: glycosyltransferase family 2 protein [bacterium]